MPAYIGFMRIRWEEMAAASVLALIPVITLTMILRKRVIRGLTFGAVKG
jgi:ABC-type glycerol-3-phosphate transport system permease component